MADQATSGAAAPVERARVAANNDVGPLLGVLAQRIAAGDATAEQPLLAQLQRPLRAMLRRHAREADVDDLAQDTLLAVLQTLRRGSLHTPEALIAFVLQTGRNLASNAGRKHVRRRTDTDSEAIEAVLDESSDPLTTLQQDERQRCVQGLLATLPTERDRDLLRRFYLADAERAALQAEYGLSAAQFDRVLYRARQRFGMLVRGCAELDSP
jgi:RNA polymerase sigma-70 factor (ECF subfamily)